MFYGDESGVCLLPCITYGWQFADEKVSVPSTSGKGVNCFALLSRDNRCFFRLTEQNINARLVCDYLDQFANEQAARCFGRITVVVLDNAPVHQGQIRKCLSRWQKKGLYVFFLPTYSPHLNIVEVLWRKLKYEWLKPSDYNEKSLLCLRVWQALAAVGTELNIAFKKFCQN